MSEYIERKSVERVFQHYIENKQLHTDVEIQVAEWIKADIDNILSAKVQPVSCVENICRELGEVFGFPCNFSPMDEFMFDNGGCEDYCCDMKASDCWERYFKIKFKGE